MTVYVPHGLFDDVNKYREDVGANLLFSRIDYLSPDVDFLFICFSNRSGSTYLAELIATTGQFGVAQELMNYDRIRDWNRENQGRHFADYFSCIVNQHQFDGRFISKLSITQLGCLAVTGVLEAILPRTRFIVLERMDKLGQALSWQVANQKQVFTSYHEDNSIEPVFDWEQIKRDIDGILRSRVITDQFFAMNGLIPFGIIYEHLRSHPQAIGVSLGRWLCKPTMIFDPARIRIKKQDTPLTQAWRSTFIELCTSIYAPHVQSECGWSEQGDSGRRG